VAKALPWLDAVSGQIYCKFNTYIIIFLGKHPIHNKGYLKSNFQIAFIVLMPSEIKPKKLAISKAHLAYKAAK